MAFFNFAREELHLVNFTEEPPLAYVGLGVEFSRATADIICPG